MKSSLWRDRDFLKLWTGQAISQMGSRITRSGLPWAALLTLNASSFQMGILNFAGAGVLVFGLFAGAWADRVRRRPLMIGADLARFALVGSIPAAAALHRLTFGHLYLVAAAAGILTVLFDVSYQAYVPSLVERGNIVEANGKLTLTESIAEVTGPGLTGVLVQLITAPMAILLDALSFACSAVSLAVITKPEPPPAGGSEPHMVREIREGLRFSWRDPALRALILFTATSAFFLGFYTSLYELFANRELRVGPALLGAVISVGGIGSLFGSIISEHLVHRCGVGPVLIGSAGVLGIAALLPPLARGPVWAAAGLLILAQVFDAAWPVYLVCARSLRQAIAPERLLGRVNAAIHLTFSGVLAVGALAGGMLADVIGARFTLLAGGLGFLLASLWLVFSPIRRMRDLPNRAWGNDRVVD